MAESEPVVKNLLPDRIAIPNAADASMSAGEMREIKKASGLRIDYLVGDEADLDEKSQMMVWLTLRRAGYNPTWEEALAVLPVPAEEPPDPTSVAPSTVSPPSVDSGE